MFLVDGHVHIYDCFDLDKFFNSAYANFKLQAIRSGKGDSFTGVLLLAETAKKSWFHRLKNYSINREDFEFNTTCNWTFNRTNENCSLFAQSNTGQSLLLIAGRQIVTAEGLEVLALATTSNFKGDTPIEELIETIRKQDAIPVIPWGFGKWLGQRGIILKRLIEASKNQELFLGDNGGRPTFFLCPSHFKQAERNGIRTLPGSDPLPFVSECIRAGSFGFLVDGSIKDTYPARDLKRILFDPEKRFQPYGNLQPLFPFVLNQIKAIAMKLRRKKSSSKKGHAL